MVNLAGLKAAAGVEAVVIQAGVDGQEIHWRVRRLGVADVATAGGPLAALLHVPRPPPTPAEAEIEAQVTPQPEDMLGALAAGVALVRTAVLAVRVRPAGGEPSEWSPVELVPDSEEDAEAGRVGVSILTLAAMGDIQAVALAGAMAGRAAVQPFRG